MNIQTNAYLLNKNCKCVTLDKEQLRMRLERDPLLQGLYQNIAAERPNLFSSTTVFISDQELRQMSSLINIIEKVIRTQGFREMALAQSPALLKEHGPQGVFMAYDFHLGDDGPKLIEINTNAGGGLLNLELAKAHQNCCKSENAFFDEGRNLGDIDKEYLEMFRNEWSLQNKETPLSVIAIVDDKPESQYLYPEFQLFERFFSAHGIKALIADPGELEIRENKLWLKETKIDLVYNRLTDFYLEEENHASIRKAYEDGIAVVTPAPHHHALYANKLNLITLTKGGFLSELGCSTDDILTLKNGIPETIKVSPENSTYLWNNRKELFFKPISGYGGKATYRGDKITHKMWAQVLSEDYIAQKIVHPTERIVMIDESHSEMKFDIRAYVYQGKIQLLASRLYRGQTTNFRTAGGGFAPVFTVIS